ncbi:MAG TPA: chloride channel protein [Verrucomicrobiae bacterium]|nr:chloride channel protein [Verrucomicrobiae bacterium]
MPVTEQRCRRAHAREILTDLFAQIPEPWRGRVELAAMGVSAGGIAVSFQFAVNILFDGTIRAMSSGSLGSFAAKSLCVILAASLLSGLLLRKLCPDAAGSGIPQVRLAFWKETGWIPWRTVWVKFLAGATTIGTGVSLGREGPTVQLASGLASNIAGLLGRAKQRRRSACAAGAAAGLAAAFNTPLAAIMFVIEEIVGGLNNRYLGGVILASVLGALVVHALVGAQPAFGISLDHAPSTAAYLAVLFVAPTSGLIGAAFQRLALAIRRRACDSLLGRQWWFPAVGGVTSWALAFGTFALTGRTGVFGLGYRDLTDALAGDIGLGTALLLLLAKLIATAAAYGTGGCGGIFAPSLFFGGTCGCAMAAVASRFVPLSGDDQTVLAIAGMCACFCAVVRAPITAILMLFEMTQQFFIVPILMLAALLGEPIGRLLSRNNFYEAILVQDGHDLAHVKPPPDLREWQNVPVSAIGNFNPVMVRSLARDHLTHILASTPHHQYPLVSDERLVGILSRGAIEVALATGHPPDVQPPRTIAPDATLQAAEMALIESPSHILVIKRPGPESLVLGVLTLHDILRRQIHFAERG